MASMFHNWRFEANRGIQPEFILKDDKNFHLSALNRNKEICPTTNLMNYKHRILSIIIDFEGLLLCNIRKDPSGFSNLTSLELESVIFDQNSLLILAPNLEYLRLSGITSCEVFDFSSVDEESKCFTKLRTFIAERNYMEIDIKKILSKCCYTLKLLKLSPLKLSHGLEDLTQEFSLLNQLTITTCDHLSNAPLRNLLSKCSGSLKTLDLTSFSDNLDFSTILVQTMNITTLEIFQGKGIELFLNKCPLIQKLYLDVCEEEFSEIKLIDLTNLELVSCGTKTMESVFNQTFKCSLKTVNITNGAQEILQCNFPVILNLDKVLVDVHYQCWSSEDLKKKALDNVVKLFPDDSKVGLIVTRWNLSDDKYCT